jgi:hypothetical protein
MKVQATYKGKTVEIDIPDEKLEELVKEQKKTGWEKPIKGEYYYCVSQSGYIHDARNNNDSLDNRQYDSGNCFTSKELAENIARYQSLDLRIRRRIAEICKPVDWNDDCYKWAIIFDHKHCQLYSDFYKVINFGGYYCDTEEHAEQIIKEFKDELMWYFTEFRDRMDG